ncbi:MAG: glycosyl transferase family A [Deltaproteobacteria bacterium RIFOXYD12_FULL_57_12]|nr:MAG: glycosyl transferase family A [Deltaproteobacteria bacterium RIFOXYD12_FULL_57_12]
MEKYVSVIIPTFNRAEYLGEAIDSVLAQTYPFFELIVVDDGSTDRTAEVVRCRQAESLQQITYLWQENRGPAAARNKGIKAASFDLLAFLDSDDRFDKRKFAIQMATMLEQPACLVSHTDETWYRRGELLNQKQRHRKSGGDILARCLELCAVGMSTVLARRGFFELIGLFDEDFPCCEDYDLWLRASSQMVFHYIDQPLTIKHGGRPDQLSIIHRVGMDAWRIKAIVKLLDCGRLNPDQHCRALAELARKCRIYGSGCLKHGRQDEGHFYLGLPGRYGYEEGGETG